MDRQAWWLLVALLGTTLLGFGAGWLARGMTRSILAPRAPAPVVSRVIEGDTLELATGEKVRLIGVDIAETKHPRKPVEAFGQEATALTRQLTEGKPVRLEFVVQRRDQYGRILAYVYVGDVMLNAELVRLGYAQVATFAPNVKYQGLFLKLQREAREARRGLWAVQ
jgi:micrococcal nuclease